MAGNWAAHTAVPMFDQIVTKESIKAYTKDRAQ